MMGTWILAPRYVITPGMQVKVVNSYDATCKPCAEKKQPYGNAQQRGLTKCSTLSFEVFNNEEWNVTP